MTVNLIGAVFCAGKDEDGGQLRVVEQVQKQTDFSLSIDKINMLSNCFDWVSGYSNLNHFRGLLDAFGEVAYFRSYCGRKEHSLAICRQGVNDFLDVPDKAHIEHSVGLVENEDFDVPQVDGSSIHMVKKSSWCSNNDVNASMKSSKLPIDVYAAVNGKCSNVEETAIASYRLFNLHRQLSRRREDKRADKFSFGRVFVAEAVEDWQDKSGGFTCSGLSAADNVFACNSGGNHLGLNFSGSDVAGGKNALDERVGKTKSFKWH